MEEKNVKTLSESRKILSENTLIPVSLVFAICAVVYSFSTVYAHVERNTAQIENTIQKRFEVDKRLFDQMNELREKIGSVSNHVYELNGKIDTLIYRSQKKDSRKKSRR